MDATLASHGEALALELYAFLREFDTVRFRAHRLPSARNQLDLFSTRVDALLRGPSEGTDDDGPDAEDALRASLSRLQAHLLSELPEAPSPRAARAEWRALRAELIVRYEDLSSSLEAWDIHVPSLRPTNHVRSLFHLASALSAVAVLHLAPSPTWVQAVCAGLVATAWLFETTRRVSGRVNDVLMWVFGPVAHPHESHRVNSATWYVSALLIMALLEVPVASTLALIILGTADPAAAFVGRRHGRIPLVHGRTLEGTAAFVVTGTILGTGGTALLFPGLPLGSLLLTGLVAAFVSGLAELFSRRIDDNLSIPLSATLAAWAVLAALGLPG